MTDETFTPADFVYCGLRLGAGGKRLACIRAVHEDGTLSAALFCAVKKGLPSNVGGVYRGAEFSGQSARGVGQAQYVERWHDEEARIAWAAESAKAEAMHARKRLESSERFGDLEHALLRARKLYDAMRARRDMSGCRALEEAVLQALHTPVSSSEH